MTFTLEVLEHQHRAWSLHPTALVLHRLLDLGFATYPLTQIRSQIMAEIITVAGVAITLPGILSGAWTVLTAAYGLYGQVDMRRTQIKLLLDRCQDLIEKIAQRLSVEPASLSDAMQASIAELQRICQDVKDILERLKKKGFLWCMMNQDKIDAQITDVQYKLTDAFDVFNFLGHVEMDEFQQDMRRAREQDHNALVSKLDQLSANDERILDAIQEQGGAHKRVEELLVAVLKCVKNQDIGPEASPQSQFLQSAGNVLRRRSKSVPAITEDWVVTSLEVDFDTRDPIGRGSFGQVYKGRWDAVRVAIKQMYVDDARTLSESDRKDMYKEVKLWSKLHHPNIIGLYGACLEATMPFLVMQFCQFGNLRNYLPKHPNANRIDLSYDVVAGLSYLHGRGIVHADLKGVNILVDDKENALVADFGLCQVIDGIRTQSVQSTRAVGPRGTLRWMAPECLDGETPTKSSDIYSLGVTIWEIFSEEIPFSRISERILTRHVVDKKQRPGRPSALTTYAVWELVQSCWAHDPGSRPSISTVQRKLEPYTTRLGSLKDPGPHSKSRTPNSKHSNTAPAAAGQGIESKAASDFAIEWSSSLSSRPPTWQRGNPSNYIDGLQIPEVPTDQQYQYRVVTDGNDLGIRPTYSREPDGSQRINLLEYNQGYGVADTRQIEVYAVDPTGDGVETLVAER